MEISDSEILVSYDVTSLFTNVFVDKTIDNIIESALENNSFNKEHNINITKSELVELLRMTTKNQLYQWDGNLYEQIDGVAMGSPLGLINALKTRKTERSGKNVARHGIDKDDISKYFRILK